ncbi:hypothetical protein BIW11_03811, partial [Tropilaelaps mercedesae]
YLYIPQPKMDLRDDAWPSLNTNSLESHYRAD